MLKTTKLMYGASAFALTCLLAQPALSTEIPEVAVSADDEVYAYDGPIERIQVVGSKKDGSAIPGSATRLNAADLDRFDSSDILRVLRQIPGVNIQEEDGFGLRPNIGLRGTGVERSEKITIMEDGVLISPAPYAAPAAYYFPTTARMEAVEVRKGSAAVKFGPRSVGGALNLVSRSIPDEFSGAVEVKAGSFDQRTIHGFAGGSAKNFGGVIEYYHAENDGFKDLPKGGDTGYDITDYLIKFRVNTDEDADIYQSLEVKYTNTDGDSNETYVGLSDADFAADPYQRYAASQLDFMDTQHEQISLTHALKAGKLELVTVAYENDFKRDWFKLHNQSKLSFDVLSGRENSDVDALQVRHNNRVYRSRGIQSLIGLNLDQGDIDHDLEMSLRYHEDSEDRLQYSEFFTLTNGQMIAGAVSDLGSEGNRINSAEAWAFMVQDTITIDEWTLTPGVRYESIALNRRDWNDEARIDLKSEKINSLKVIVPGIGLAYQIADNTRLVGGLYKGFNPAGAGSTDASEESSWNVEAGVSGELSGISYDFVGFWSDYSNVLGTCASSNGCLGDIGDQFNGGAVDVLGLEASISSDFVLTNGISMPWSILYTWTDAEFSSTFEDSFWGDVVSGDRLPYLPSHQLTLNTGLHADRWSVDLSANYVSKARTDAGHGAIAPSESVDARWVVDLGARYSLLENIDVFISVDNLFDNVYSVANRPFGKRPGKPRSVIVGAKFSF